MVEKYFLWMKVGIVATLLIFAGCNGFGATTSTRSQTEATTATATSTVTPSPTSTATEDGPANWSQNRKYRYFAGDYYDSAAHSVQEYSITIDNGTINFTYKMRDPSNGSEKRNETAALLTTYSALADIYLNESNPEVGEEWIPRRLNVTALDPETKKVYWRGHTNYTVMNEYRTGEREYPGYVIPYYNSLEWGPAHPDYEKD